MSDDIVATTHGYACRYTPTIMSGPVFRWRCEFGFEVSASRDGVMLHGASPCFGPSSLSDFRAVLTLAERVHCRLSCDDRGTDVCRQMIAAAA